MASSPALSGLLVVDKPMGWTSMDVVRRVRSAAGGAKTGHAGTLDPLATGVLICCLGRATRSVQQVMGMTKVYAARVDLSAVTSTDDLESEPIPVTNVDPPECVVIRDALDQFVGSVPQRPPDHSAVHVGGQRAYKLARRGQRVDLKPRIVRIDAIDVLDYAWPLLDLRIRCGRGTYMRSLARDLGNKLGTGGYLASLRRIAIGSYNVSMAINPTRLEMIAQADLLDVPWD